MESGKKHVSVVALLAAMVALQLMAAPAAMARPMQAMKGDGSRAPLPRQIMEELILSKLGKLQYCGETCYLTGCHGSGCSCVPLGGIPWTTFNCMRSAASLSVKVKPFHDAVLPCNV